MKEGNQKDTIQKESKYKKDSNAEIEEQKTYIKYRKQIAKWWT